MHGAWWVRDETEENRETIETFSCSTAVLCSFLKTGLTAASVANSGDFSKSLKIMLGSFKTFAQNSIDMKGFDASISFCLRDCNIVELSHRGPGHCGWATAVVLHFL